MQAPVASVLLLPAFFTKSILFNRGLLLLTASFCNNDILMGITAVKVIYPQKKSIAVPQKRGDSNGCLSRSCAANYRYPFKTMDPSKEISHFQNRRAAQAS